MKKIKTYLYCVWLNKATLLGYIMLFAVITLHIMGFFDKYKSSLVVIYQLATFPLLATSFGSATYSLYSRCIKIAKQGKAKLIVNNYKAYCYRVVVIDIKKRYC